MVMLWWLEKFFGMVILLVAIKAIIGFRFPWETCGCCGKKIRDHKT